MGITIKIIRIEISIEAGKKIMSGEGIRIIKLEEMIEIGNIRTNEISKFIII